MPELQHIIAATDLSPASLDAVDRGFELASLTGARYTLVHALGLDALGPLRNLIGEQAEGVTEKAMQHQREALEAVAADATRNRGVVARIHVEEGLATRFVPAYADSVHADLIVVGARGQGVIRRLLLGSTASRLLRKSHCPVLIVKTPYRMVYRRVLIPVDFSPASLDAVRMARHLAPEADILLLHVFDVPFEGMLQYAGVSQTLIHSYRTEARERSLRQLHALAADAGVDRADYSVAVEHGEAVSHITAKQAQYGCDLIVMGKHGTHVTEELLLGSVTNRVLSESDIDTLVVVDRRPAPVPPVQSAEDFV